MNSIPSHVAFFVDHDINKAQFAMKYLASQMSVYPVMVHVFLRNGRDEAGRIVVRKTVAKLAEARQYLNQTQITFEAIRSVGSMDYVEISMEKTDEECINALLRALEEAGEPRRLYWLRDDLCESPWSLDGERLITDYLPLPQNVLNPLNIFENPVFSDVNKVIKDAVQHAKKMKHNSRLKK